MDTGRMGRSELIEAVGELEKENQRLEKENEAAVALYIVLVGGLREKLKSTQPTPVIAASCDSLIDLYAGTK